MNRRTFLKAMSLIGGSAVIGGPRILQARTSIGEALMLDRLPATGGRPVAPFLPLVVGVTGLIAARAVRERRRPA